MIPTIKDSAGKQEINKIFIDFNAKLNSSDSNPGKDTKSEPSTALKWTPNNKSPGPDGFPAEFYKQFKYLFRAIAEINKTHMNTAVTSLPSNYRLISLINVDLKLISKALAHGTEKVSPNIII